MDLPPLFRDRAAADPVADAVAAGQAGEDPGLVTHDIAHDRMRVALLFTPEVSAEDASLMLPLCAVGFQNALGALAPPEVAVHLGWDGTIRVNGGRCGRLAMTGGDGWLIVDLDLDLWPVDGEGGETPDRTALYAEGCAEVAAPTLAEAWVRHTLTWLDTWEHEGIAPVLRDWTALTDEIGQEVSVAGETGTVLGLDERGALLVKSGADTRAVPLASLLKDAP